MKKTSYENKLKNEKYNSIKYWLFWSCKFQQKSSHSWKSTITRDFEKVPLEVNIIVWEQNKG